MSVYNKFIHNFMQGFIYVAIVLFFISCDDKGVIEQLSTINSDNVNRIYELKGSKGEIIKVKRDDNGFSIMGEEDTVIMFDIFATYCPPCKAEAPDLARLDKKYDNLRVIGLTVEEEILDEELVDFQNKYGGDYFMTGSKHNDAIINALLKDVGYENALVIPFKLIVKNGKYQSMFSPIKDSENYYYMGKIYPEMLQKDIEKVLNSNS